MMEELFEIGNDYLHSIGIPAELHRHWSNIQNFLLDQGDVGRRDQLPDVEVVPLQPVPQPEVDPALAAGGDGLHVNPQPAEQNEAGILGPALIIFRHRRLRTPFFSLERLMPIAIVLSSVVFKKVLVSFDIDSNQAFLFGVSYNTHFVIFQCLLSFASDWLKNFLRD